MSPSMTILLPLSPLSDKHKLSSEFGTKGLFLGTNNGRIEGRSSSQRNKKANLSAGFSSCFFLLTSVRITPLPSGSLRIP